MVAFGTNEWLVDEIYQQYLKDPQTVDRAWWDFFADYRPGDPATPNGPTGAATSDADVADVADLADVADGGLAIGDARDDVVDPPRSGAQPGQPDPARVSAPAPDRASPATVQAPPAGPSAPAAPTTTISTATRQAERPHVVVPELAHTVPATEVEAPASTFGPVAPAGQPLGAPVRDQPPAATAGTPRRASCGDRRPAW